MTHSSLQPQAGLQTGSGQSWHSKVGQVYWPSSSFPFWTQIWLLLHFPHTESRSGQVSVVVGRGTVQSEAEVVGVGVGVGVMVGVTVHGLGGRVLIENQFNAEALLKAKKASQKCIFN